LTALIGVEDFRLAVTLQSHRVKMRWGGRYGWMQRIEFRRRKPLISAISMTLVEKYKIPRVLS